MRKMKRIVAAGLVLSMMLTACGGSKTGGTDATEKADAAEKSNAGEQANTADGAASGNAQNSQEPEEITIWYEGGDARLPFFKAIEAEMQKDYPNYSINAVTFDNSTFMTKVLQATSATGGVDLVFNDASRLLEIDLQSNNSFEDLSSILELDSRKDLVNEGDIKLSSVAGRLVVYPVNRTIAGLGVKTDVAGVEVAGETSPATWKEFKELGLAYKKAGINGFTMILGSDPGQVFNLFLCGSGMSDIFLNGTPESQVEKNQKYFEDIVSVYAGGEEAFWDKDATSEDFSAMYTKIQSGSVGMFRAGNWNVAGWDAPDSGVGEYQVTEWPSISGDGTRGLVLLNTRGFAMPKNSEHKEAASVFLQYALKEEPQGKSFETMGSCMDLSVVDTDKLTKNQKIFFDPDVKLYPIDNYVADIPYYNDIKDVYEKGLTNAVNSKSAEEITENITNIHTSINQVIEKNK